MSAPERRRTVVARGKTLVYTAEPIEVVTASVALVPSHRNGSQRDGENHRLSPSPRLGLAPISPLDSVPPRLRPGASVARRDVHCTVTVIAAEVPRLPALSTATAVIVCVPFEALRVFQATLYGAEVLVPCSVPST